MNAIEFVVRRQLKVKGESLVGLQENPMFIVWLSDGFRNLSQSHPFP